MCFLQIGQKVALAATTRRVRPIDDFPDAAGLTRVFLRSHMEERRRRARTSHAVDDELHFRDAVDVVRESLADLAQAALGFVDARNAANPGHSLAVEWVWLNAGRAVGLKNVRARHA